MSTNLEKNIGSVGVEEEGQKLKVIGELNRKPFEELLTKGSEQWSSMPVGGDAPAAAAAASSEERSHGKKKDESDSEEHDIVSLVLFDL
ncbi:unnamed protein product [Psylliodes chrysocephalus]|uniref:Uncharacterized protein n=1 Tax=Psylliodes chrysocephalus TaxID=3402493 RepID=A0A9P0D7C4_9CUCU|nr:unnamed protein product [Psylliodes chrysocephala]